MHGAVHTVASLQGYRQQRQSTICSHRQPVGVIARCAWSSVGRLLQQQTAQLQQQKRMAQYRFQEDYLEHLRQQQVFLQNDRHPDYDRDPYFYAAPIYRYNRGGRYYETDISLNSGWEFRQLGAGDNSAGWRPAQVPGDVHLDLLRNKLIPDPFYRDNEAKLQWIENADWEYRTTIQATPDLLNHKNIELVFEGLDAYAKVYLSEQLVLTADNMFREWRVNVKPRSPRWPLTSTWPTWCVPHWSTSKVIRTSTVSASARPCT
jgi:hypothetical protein